MAQNQDTTGTAQDTALVLRFSIVTKDNGPLTKIMRLDPNTGAVVKDSSQCSMSSGTIETKTVRSFPQIAETLRQLTPNQALVHGISLYNKAQVTTKNNLENASSGRPADALPIISRSKDHIDYPDGPALMMFDHDKARDNSVADNEAALQSYTPEELIELISPIIPGISDAGWVSTPSTSSCIYDKDGKELRGEGTGSHTYFVVENGRDIPRFLKVLGERLIIAGHGRVEISRSGALLPKALVDLSVGSPERLDFAAGAVCYDGLVQKLPDPKFKEGNLLNTASLLDLTPAEELEYEAIKQRLIALAKPSQVVIEGKYIEQEATKLSTEKKISVNEARHVVVSRQNHVLTDDDQLYFAHLPGKTVSVAEVLTNPTDYDKKALADPLEPEYGGWSLTKAMFYWNDGKPTIHSYAHGSINYTFKQFEKENVCWTDDEIVAFIERVKTDCGAPFEPESVKKLAHLKHSDKARFMKVRDEIKRANRSVILPELDKDIRIFLEQSNSKSSSSSSSSISGSYTSSGASSNKVHPFQDALLITKNGKHFLAIDSIAAALIAEELHGKFAFDAAGSLWRRFTINHWKTCEKFEFDTAVTVLVYVGAGELGFKNAYPNGITALLQKNGQNRLPVHPVGMIPFQNGLLDIATKNLEPITPDNATTWVLPFDYTAEAQCPNFLDWLNIAVDKDDETIRLLQAWINAVLTGRPDLQVFLHLIGPAGTGKGTFGRIIYFLVGTDNATTTTLRELETNRFEGANIFGKRLVIIGEANKYGGAVNILKSMTGQDPLRLERKNQQQQGSFIYGGQTLVTSNEQLSTTDYTSGIERRRMTVALNHRITQEEGEVFEKRGGEEAILYTEIPGIVNWVLELSPDEVTSIIKKMPERVFKANLEAARFNNPLLDWMLHNLLPDTASKNANWRQARISELFWRNSFQKA